MNNCAYTGARVLLKGRDCVVAADLYDQGEIVVIRYTPGSEDFSPEAVAAATHSIHLHYHDVFDHPVAGVVVVPKMFLNGGLYR